MFFIDIATSPGAPFTTCELCKTYSRWQAGALQLVNLQLFNWHLAVLVFTVSLWAAVEQINPLMGILKPQGNGPLYSNAVIGNLVYWPLMGWLLHLVQRGGAWAGWGRTQSPSHCTRCNSPEPTHQWPVYQLHIIGCGTVITCAH